MTSTGRVAATTLNHRFHTLGLEMTLPCRSPKGHSFLMDYVKRHDFKFFGIYRIVLGAIVLAVAAITALA